MYAFICCLIRYMGWLGELCNLVTIYVYMFWLFLKRCVTWIMLDLSFRLVFWCLVLALHRGKAWRWLLVLIRLWACVTKIGFLNVSDGVVDRGANLCSHMIYVFNFIYVNRIMDWGFYASAAPLLAMVPKPMARMCKTWNGNGNSY